MLKLTITLLLLADGKTILRTSEADGYNHIYAINFDGTSTQITSGKWDVIELKGINEDKGIVFYTSAEKGAIYKDIYSIKMNGSKKTCLTENEKGYADGTFSTGMKFFLKRFSNAATPTIYSLCDAKGKVISELEDNAKFAGEIEKMNLPKKEFMMLKGAEGDLNAWMIKPSNFDPKKQYPVYVNIYGG